MITSMIPSMQCSTPSRITGFISVSECLLHPILHEVLVDKFVIVTVSVIFRRIPRGKGKEWGTGRERGGELGKENDKTDPVSFARSIGPLRGSDGMNVSTLRERK